MALRPTRLIRWALPVALLALFALAFALRFAGTTVTETRHFDPMDEACAGVSFLHCYADMERAQERYDVGQQLAICDDGDGTGSVVALASDEDPEDACLDAPVPGPLLRVIELLPPIPK